MFKKILSIVPKHFPKKFPFPDPDRAFTGCWKYYNRHGYVENYHPENFFPGSTGRGKKCSIGVYSAASWCAGTSAGVGVFGHGPAQRPTP